MKLCSLVPRSINSKPIFGAFRLWVAKALRWQNGHWLRPAPNLAPCPNSKITRTLAHNLMFTAPLCILLFSASCAKKNKEPTAYQKDVEKICHAIEHADAVGLPKHDQALMVAKYLGANLESKEGRELSIKISKSGGKERVDLLSKASQKIGLAKCDLIDFLGE